MGNCTDLCAQQTSDKNGTNKVLDEILENCIISTSTYNSGKVHFGQLSPLKKNDQSLLSNNELFIIAPQTLKLQLSTRKVSLAFDSPPKRSDSYIRFGKGTQVSLQILRDKKSIIREMLKQVEVKKICGRRKSCSDVEKIGRQPACFQFIRKINQGDLKRSKSWL